MAVKESTARPLRKQRTIKRVLVDEIRISSLFSGRVQTSVLFETVEDCKPNGIECLVVASRSKAERTQCMHFDDATRSNTRSS